MIMQDFVYWYIFLYVFVCGLYMYPELATRESRFFLGLEYTSWISFTIACSFFESTLKATIARSQETSSSSIWGNSLPRQVCPQNSVLYLCFWEYLNISDFTPQNPVWHFDLWGARAFCILESGGVLVDGVENVKLRNLLRQFQYCLTSELALESHQSIMASNIMAKAWQSKIGLPFSGGLNCDLTLPKVVPLLIALQCLELQNDPRSHHPPCPLHPNLRSRLRFEPTKLGYQWTHFSWTCPGLKPSGWAAIL